MYTHTYYLMYYQWHRHHIVFQMNCHNTRVYPNSLWNRTWCVFRWDCNVKENFPNIKYQNIKIYEFYKIFLIKINWSMKLYKRFPSVNPGLASKSGGWDTFSSFDLVTSSHITLTKLWHHHTLPWQNCDIIIIMHTLLEEQSHYKKGRCTLIGPLNNFFTHPPVKPWWQFTCL